MSNKEKKKIDIKTILLLQGLVLVYSLNGTLSKVASNSMQIYGAFSVRVILIMGCAVAVLGVYAIFWQKILKKIELSVAYANKGIGILWTLVWSVILFKESITINNVVGIIIICIGVIVVTSHE